MPFRQLFRKKRVSDILQAHEAEQKSGKGLSRHLGFRDLTAFGIAAIIGAGIFSTIGKASFNGGPGVVFLFVFVAIACSFAALAYAEFASLVPVSGSAYTYSYVTFGELFAWIIGWALIMEYAIGNIVVAISWSDYFTTLMEGTFRIHIPEWMTMDYFTAKAGFQTVSEKLAGGMTLEQIAAVPELQNTLPAYQAWAGAPMLGSLRIILDIPALGMIFLITWLVYRGIRESRFASNLMVAIKVIVVMMVIAVGFFYVNPDNWAPFMPNGTGGLLMSISAVFFAYIGFDAISTTAEEAKNPQRDLPRAILSSIIICTVLYILIALVLTGMVHYTNLNVGDPLAFVFEKIPQLNWFSGFIALSAVIAMSSVFLVFQLGQPRIWMSMSRDGLLPPRFSKVHPKFKTPAFATVVTGFVVAIPTLFLDLDIVADICSLGTLFAFTLVCAGVLRLEQDPNGPRGKFRVPYLNSRYLLPLILLVIGTLTWVFSKDDVLDFAYGRQLRPAAEITVEMQKEQYGALAQLQQDALALQGDTRSLATHPDTAAFYLEKLFPSKQAELLRALPVADSLKYDSGWTVIKSNLPMWLFLIIAVYMLIRAVWKKLSLLPVLGMLSCLYLMAQLGFSNWIGFLIWLGVGLLIYFLYGYRHSKLKRREASS